MGDRQPIDAGAVVAALAAPDRWTVRHVPSTGSTNADLAAEPAATDGRVLLAEEQLAGRGRLGRSWSAPAGSSLILSIRLSPPVPPARRGWVGVALGLAVVDAVADRTGLIARLKWPNDLLIDGRKCAGILAEVAGDDVVVGVGINVTVAPDELPPAGGGSQPATSLQLAGGRDLDRAALAAALLNGLDALLDRWYATAGDPVASGLLERYRQACATLGSAVRAELPTGESVVGTAVDIGPDGRLTVDTPGGRRDLSAADVVHLRPASGSTAPAPVSAGRHG